MSACLRWLPVAALVLATGSASAAPLFFNGNPITCIDPVGATVPTPCGLTTAPRADGYSLIGYSFNFLIPPPGPLPPFPIVVKNDSMRDFFNPVLQDILVQIFGNTKVDVDGAPVEFFVSGTLDGAVVASYSETVGGHDNHVAWNVAGKVDDVAAGVHTLDMHFGFIQLIPNQPSNVNIASLYQVTAQEVPEPSSLALVLGALCVATLGGACVRQRTDDPALAA